MKKISILPVLSLATLLTFSACSNKNSAGDGAPNGGDGLAPPPIEDNSASVCDPASPQVTDFFTGNPLTVEKSFNRYEKYVGHQDGVIKAYTHSGTFTAYNKDGSTVHVVKDQIDLNAPGTLVADLDVKSPIQDLALVKIGDNTKLLVGTRHNLQVFNVTGNALAPESTSSALDGILDIETANGKTFVTNLKGDVYLTPHDSCLNTKFSRIYEAASDRDTILKHDYVAHKVKTVGDKVFIMTRNRNEFEMNLVQLSESFSQHKFYFWKNKVRFVNLADKSTGEVKLTTPTTPNVSASDIAVSESKLYIAANEFPASPYFTSWNSAVQTCASTANPPLTCVGLSAELGSWMLMYLFGNAGVLVHDAGANLTTSTPVFNAILPNFILGPIQLNTGFFYSPRIALAADTLYMTGLYGLQSLPNVSTGNTVWEKRIPLDIVNPANVDFIFPTSLEVWDNIIRRNGLMGIDNYNFATDVMAGYEDSNFFSAQYFFPTEQGRGVDAKHTDIYQWNKRSQVLNAANTTSFLTGGGSQRGYAVIKGATYEDDRYLNLKKEAGNYELRKFKTNVAAAEQHFSIPGGGDSTPLYSILQLMTNLRSADTNYSFAVFFDSATGTYKIRAVNNNFTNVSPLAEVMSTPAAGAGITLSGFPMGFQKVVTTNENYILYISVVNLALPGSIFNIDRVVIQKDSVPASFALAAGYPDPVITDLKTIPGSGSLLFAMDADENNVYILGTDGILTTKNADGSVIGAPLNVYNFSAGEMLISIPPSIYVKNNKAYMNGLYIGLGSLFKIGMGYAIADLSTGTSHKFPEAQYFSIHGSERLIGTSLMNENGIELFEF